MSARQATVTSPCRCVTSHAPTPSEYDTHLVVPPPKGMDGPRATLCPTAHRNAHVLWNLYVDHEGKPPGHELRRFNSEIRSMVAYAWGRRPDNPVKTKPTDCAGTEPVANETRPWGSSR